MHKSLKNRTVGCSRRAIFLDRDGTIISDVGYPNDPEQVKLLPGVGEALSTLKALGFYLILISNQSGIGRGIVTPNQARQVHLRTLSYLAEHAVDLDATYYCPHTPESHCRCRKPSPFLLQRASEELGIDLPHSFMIGDKSIDVLAGQQAGCHTILLAQAFGLSDSPAAPDFVASNWSEVLRFVMTYADHGPADRRNATAPSR